MGGTNARDWVIDRDRDSYLRNVAHGGGAEPELRSRTIWSFQWRGSLLTLRLDLLESGGERRGLVPLESGVGQRRRRASGRTQALQGRVSG